nr:hypothetical protein [uncultured Cohaesibacter sp.]
MLSRCPDFLTRPFLCLGIKAISPICLASLLCLGAAGARAQEGDPAIDLRLFGQNVIEEYNGCHLAFWQANKDPEADKFAYVFYAPFNDGEELPAWMKIGKTVFEFQRQDEVESGGQELESLRLYRTSKGTYTTLLEVTEQHVSGSTIVVDKAKLTVTQSKHYPFVISVKGGIFCPDQTLSEQTDQPQNEQSLTGQSQAGQSPSGQGQSRSGMPSGVIAVDPPFGDPVPLEEAIPFDSLDAVPRGTLSAIRRDAPECNMDQTAGFGAHYAISDSVTLWEVPCNLYAKTGSSVYVASMNDNSDFSTVLPFPSLPGMEGATSNHEIRNPQMDISTGTVTSEYYDGDGSCGSFEAYQLRSVEGEALEFFLLEYREKPTCDGIQTSARQFPLRYTAQ